MSRPPVAPQPPPAGWPPFAAALAYDGFRRIWTGAFLSGLGTWTQDVALAWYIHTRFADPAYLGLRTFAAEAPLLAFMLLGGAVADRADRRTILLGSQVSQMAFAVALLSLYLTDRLGIAAILALAFLTGTAQSQSAPTYQAVITSLVPPQRISNAVALNSLQFNLSRALGPALAGLLLASSGSGACFAVNAISFLAVIVALLRIPPLRPAQAPREGFRRSLVVGVSHVRRSPGLRALTALGATCSLLAFPMLTFLPVLADDLGSGARGFSLLLGSFGAGAIVGALLTAHRGQAARRGRAAVFALVGYGIASLGAMSAPWLEPAAGLLFVSGACLVSALTMVNSLVQESTPEGLRGRVLSLYGLAFRGGSPLGSLAGGFLVARLGVSIAIGSYSLLLAAVAVLIGARSRTLREL